MPFSYYSAAPQAGNFGYQPQALGHVIGLDVWDGRAWRSLGTTIIPLRDPDSTKAACAWWKGQRLAPNATVRRVFYSLNLTGQPETFAHIMQLCDWLLSNYR